MDNLVVDRQVTPLTVQFDRGTVIYVRSVKYVKRLLDCDQETFADWDDCLDTVADGCIEYESFVLTGIFTDDHLSVISAH
jgi:hypothetical protein